MSYNEFLKEFISYEPITNYWDLFSISEMAGEKEVIGTYNELFGKAKSDYKLLTELVMVLNHRSHLYSKIPQDTRLCELYCTLYIKTDNYAVKHLSGGELAYFLRETD